MTTPKQSDYLPVEIVKRLPDDMAIRVGHIILAWSNVEHAIKYIVFLLANVPERIGSVVIGTVRAKDMMARVEELLIARGGTVNPPLTPIQNDLDRLEKMRNRLAHGTWGRVAADHKEHGGLLLLRETGGSWQIDGKRVPRRMLPGGEPITTAELDHLLAEMDAMRDFLDRLYRSFHAKIYASQDKSGAPLPQNHPDEDQTPVTPQDPP